MLTAEQARKKMKDDPVTLDELGKAISAQAEGGYAYVSDTTFPNRPITNELLKKAADLGYKIQGSGESWRIEW